MSEKGKIHKYPPHDHRTVRTANMRRGARKESSEKTLEELATLRPRGPEVQAKRSVASCPWASIAYLFSPHFKTLNLILVAIVPPAGSEGESISYLYSSFWGLWAALAILWFEGA